MAFWMESWSISTSSYRLGLVLLETWRTRSKIEVDPFANLDRSSVTSRLCRTATEGNVILFLSPIPLSGA